MGKYTKEDIIDGTRRVLKNGMLAGKVMTEKGERFRIIGVEDRAALRKSSARKGVRGRDKRGNRKKLSPLAAKRAFNRYYKKSPKYKTSRGRASAKRRDLCWDNQEIVSDRRYSRSPHIYDYAGLDDGSSESCEGVHKYKKGAKLNHLKKGSPEAREWHQRMETEKKKKKGGGGKRPVSLQTAVRLLRQYYTEKYA